jgi:hypothetical protein
MVNFDLTVTTASGSLASLLFDTGRDAIAWLAGIEEDEEPARHIAIEAFTDDGRKVSIVIPNDGSTAASVTIGEDASGRQGSDQLSVREEERSLLLANS